MKTLTTLGRFIYALPFILFGVFHFMQAKEMALYLSGWPIAEALVYFSGLGLILAGISIIINIKARLACLLLALLILVIIVGVHLPALSSGKAETMPSLLKDIALLGAALTYAGILKK